MFAAACPSHLAICIRNHGTHIPCLHHGMSPGLTSGHVVQYCFDYQYTTLKFSHQPLSEWLYGVIGVRRCKGENNVQERGCACVQVCDAKTGAVGIPSESHMGHVDISSHATSPG